jgi:hypothetical protein
MNTTGKPNPLTAVWIFVPNPPRLRPRACSCCPPLPSLFFLAPAACGWARMTGGR